MKNIYIIKKTFLNSLCFMDYQIYYIDIYVDYNIKLSF